MFGIGLSEIFLVVLILIIIIRPDDMPQFLRTLGKFYGKAKKTYKEIIMVKDRILKELDEAARLDDVPEKRGDSPPVKPLLPPVLPDLPDTEGGTDKPETEQVP
jgi:sec-independent protein translocase protein TatB